MTDRWQRELCFLISSEQNKHFRKKQREIEENRKKNRNFEKKSGGKTKGKNREKTIFMSAKKNNHFC